MTIVIPEDIRTGLCEAIVREECERRAARRATRQAARERARIREKARPLAARALRFARELARAQDLPHRGAEVFVCGERARTSVRVLPRGALEFNHTCGAYGGFRVVGGRARDLVDVPIDVLTQLAEAVESGKVWEHLRRGLRHRRG